MEAQHVRKLLTLENAIFAAAPSCRESRQTEKVLFRVPKKRGTSACHGWMVLEWPLNLEHLDRVHETCGSDTFLLNVWTALDKHKFLINIINLFCIQREFSFLTRVFILLRDCCYFTTFDTLRLFSSNRSWKSKLSGFTSLTQQSIICRFFIAEKLEYQGWLTKVWRRKQRMFIMQQRVLWWEQWTQWLCW